MANEEKKVFSECLLKRPRLDEDTSLSVNNRPKMQRTHLQKSNSTGVGSLEDKAVETSNSGNFRNPLTDSSNYDDNKVHEDHPADECSTGEDHEASVGDNSYDSDSVSEISDLSGLSEEAWKPIAGPISWVQRQMALGHNPRIILGELVSSDTVIPHDLDDFTLWKIVINLICEPSARKKLKHINTLDDVLHLLKTCTRVMVLTGAGVSVSCGIPDFRSRNGIYARLNVDFPDLPDPQAMFDIKYFQNDPRPFFKFAREIYPGQFEPSQSHKFIRLIEQHGKLLRNYTQNIDTLEQVAGISNIIQCHGSFATATCMSCKYKTDADSIRADIFNQVIPRCPDCAADDTLAVLKPDIVFFGESLSDEFHQQMAKDKDICDLLIVIGSSLKVRPVALIPNSLPADVPQILINREHLEHMNFDVELLGNCDEIVCELCRRLGEGWDIQDEKVCCLTEIQYSQLALAPSCSSSPFKSDQSGKLTSDTLHCDVNDNKTSCELQSVVESLAKPIEDNHVCGHERTEDHSCVFDENMSKSESDSKPRRHSSSDSVLEHDDTCYSRDKSLAERRKVWSGCEKCSIAKRLADDQYLFLPPSRYVFHGAEFFFDPDMSESDTDHTTDSTLELETSLETNVRCEMQEMEDSVRKGELETSLETNVRCEMQEMEDSVRKGELETSLETNVRCEMEDSATKEGESCAAVTPETQKQTAPDNSCTVSPTHNNGSKTCAQTDESNIRTEVN